MVKSVFRHPTLRRPRIRRLAAACATAGLLLFPAAVQAKEGHAAPLPKPPPASETPIHAAALEGDADRIVLLIENGWDVNTVSPVRGDTPLFAALEHKQAEATNVLLDRGADVNFSAIGKSTPLHHAAIWGNLEIIDRLLATGADPTRVDDVHHLPLHYAVERGYVEAAKRLLVSPELMDKSDTHDRTPLDHAVDLSRPDIALLLLHAGAHFADNPNRTLGRVGRCATKGWTEAIEIALRQTESQPELRRRIAERAYNDTFGAGNVPQLKRIGELVPGIASTKPASGLPRLFIAANFGHADMVALLLEQGADVNEAAQPSGWTPLHGAVIDYGDLNLVTLLLNEGANPNAVDGLDRTPLHTAAIAGRPYIIAQLLKFGADAARADYLGNTPLHYAAHVGAVAAVRTLLDAKAPQVANTSGKRPFDFATEAGHNDLVSILEPAPVVLLPLPENFDEISALAAPKNPPEALADLREQWAEAARRGVPLIHLAAQSGARSAVEKLLKSDGAAAARDPGGFLALHYAAEGTARELLRDLLAAGAPVNDQANPPKWTPLHFAASAGRAEAVQILLENGADKSLRDGLGRSPADLAELQGYPPIAALLR